MSDRDSGTELVDQAPPTDSFREDVIAGLQQEPQKALPCKYLYDERGSRLFEQICTLDEYYLTRTEVAIMKKHVREMVAVLGPRVLLIEYGSGSSRKTRILLDHLPDPTGYVPVDISREHLRQSAERLRRRYEGVSVRPVCADYTAEFELPEVPGSIGRRVVYFPGSTIGNMNPEEAQRFMEGIAGQVGTGGGLLIGVDLKKDADILEAAYNDREGVTAAFNKNVLRRINRELDGTFRLDCFHHRAVYNDEEGRVESYLVSQERQKVQVDGIEVDFEEGEAIHTENSYKYDQPAFGELARQAGFAVERVWTDENSYFSVQYLAAG